MHKDLFIRLAVPTLAALLVAGCSQRQKASYSHPANYGYQGAPPVEQTTEVVTASGGIVDTNSQADIQLHKEEMVVGKREVSNGGVLIRTVVQNENVSQPIELRREEYVIERVPASEALASTATAFQGREIYIPLTREEPLASKRALLSEKVQLGKRIETDRQTVSTPIRSEDVQITKVAGKSAGTYWQEAAVAAPAPAEANALKLYREEMVVGKTVVDNGGVKLQKVVRTQTASQPIELQRQEFTIDRSPIPQPEVASTDFSQREIKLSLSREEPVVGTRIQSTEWVRVRKQVHTDTQTVSGTVRKENIEIVKLAADQAAMGGTSAASQSGTSFLSESGSPKVITIKGKALCAKCQLHQAANCQNVIQVQNAKGPVNYYLVQHDVNNVVFDAKSFHENVCKEGKMVTATGSVRQVDGKLAFTPSSIRVLN